MKKLLVAFIVILILSVGGVYFFIPGKLNIIRIEQIKANQQGIIRTMMNDDKWGQWWPAEIQGNIDGFSIGKNSLTFHDINFRIQKVIVSGIEMEIQDNATSVNSVLTIVPFYVDSTQVEWKCEISTSLNPVKRFLNYRRAKEISRDMDSILSSMRAFMEDRKNIYDMQIEQIKVTDTLLVSTNTFFAHYPTMPEIYELFKRLENYANHLGAKRTSWPMLHIERTENNIYETVVAIPINKVLPNEGNYVFKRMVPGNIIVGEVTGGFGAIQSGFVQLTNFLHDYQKGSVAIQFESLVTDRLKEPDTSKWVTRLYYPVY
jgi:hypothetical protein